MRLRPRLALTALLAGIPLIAGSVWARSAIERSNAVDGLTRLVMQRMLEGGRDECSRWPESWPIPSGPGMGRGTGPGTGPGMGPGMGPGRGPGMGGEGMPTWEERQTRMQAMLRGGGGPRAFSHLGPPVEFFAYSADLTSRNRLAPALHDDLRTGLLDGRNVVSRGRSNDSDSPLEIAVRMDWFDEPESPSAIVLARQVGASEYGLAREFLWGVTALVSVMLLTLLLSAGPVVGRARRLTRNVRRSATDQYATSIPVEGSDEISELALAFNAAGAQCRAHTDLLEQRERSLREFVEGTTHDVMLPLTVLQGHLTGLAKTSSGEQAATLRDAIEEAHYLTSLIQNLATTAKLEAEDAPPRRDPVDLVALCERVVARHMPVGREKGVRVEPVLPGDPVVVRGDETLLEQAVSNLVHNAVRYVDRDGRVLVVLSAEAGRFSLRVLDDGPGISPDQIGHLTERRWRADDVRARHPSGSGLGLAIAKEVALRHTMELTLGTAPELGGLEADLQGALG